MSKNVVAVTPEMTLRDTLNAAARYKRDHGIHRALVQNGEELLGVVTTGDITNAVADQRVGTRSFIFNRDSGFDDRNAWQAADMPDDDG